MLTEEEYNALFNFVMSRKLDGCNLYDSKIVLEILGKIHKSVIKTEVKE